jgi:hypothetical protein
MHFYTSAKKRVDSYASRNFIGTGRDLQFTLDLAHIVLYNNDNEKIHSVRRKTNAQ